MTAIVWLGLSVVVIGLLGCAGGAQLVRDDDEGGVVTYLYKNSGVDRPFLDIAMRR